VLFHDSRLLLFPVFIAIFFCQDRRHFSLERGRAVINCPQFYFSMLPDVFSCTSAHGQVFTLGLADFSALAPGLERLEEWRAWSVNPDVFPDAEHPVATPLIPMMLARRMGKGSRFATQTALSLLQRHSVDALVHSSRHGELERTSQILNSIETGGDVSPTDFAMSVHNAASGQLTISARLKVPSVSVAAGPESFQQSLHEVLAFLSSGKRSVLHVDFEPVIPEFYQDHVPRGIPPYAAAFLWQGPARVLPECEAGGVSAASVSGRAPDARLPQSLRFLAAILQERRSFTLS
jgi:hypothetical protein